MKISMNNMYMFKKVGYFTIFLLTLTNNFISSNSTAAFQGNKSLNGASVTQKKTVLNSFQTTCNNMGTSITNAFMDVKHAVVQQKKSAVKTDPYIKLEPKELDTFISEINKQINEGDYPENYISTLEVLLNQENRTFSANTKTHSIIQYNTRARGTDKDFIVLLRKKDSEKYMPYKIKMTKMTKMTKKPTTSPIQLTLEKGDGSYAISKKDGPWDITGINLNQQKNFHMISELQTFLGKLNTAMANPSLLLKDMNPVVNHNNSLASMPPQPQMIAKQPSLQNIKANVGKTPKIQLTSQQNSTDKTPQSINNASSMQSNAANHQSPIIQNASPNAGTTNEITSATTANNSLKNQPQLKQPQPVIQPTNSANQQPQLVIQAKQTVSQSINPANQRPQLVSQQQQPYQELQFNKTRNQNNDKSRNLGVNLQVSYSSDSQSSDENSDRAGNNQTVNFIKKEDSKIDKKQIYQDANQTSKDTSIAQNSDNTSNNSDNSNGSENSTSTQKQNEEKSHGSTIVCAILIVVGGLGAASAGGYHWYQKSKSSKKISVGPNIDKNGNNIAATAA
jgi:hypothetical protein